MLANTLRWLIPGLLLSVLCVGASASPLKAFTYKVKNNQPVNAVISNAPKATLLLVNPSPLPRVDPGDTQQITVQWRANFGLRSSNSLCATRDRSVAPAFNDPCVNLPGAMLLASTKTSNTFEDTLVLPATFYRPSASFYVRTTAQIYVGGAPNWSASNLVGFVWPLSQTNLYAHNPSMDFSQGMIRLVHKVSNNSNVDADASLSRFEVRLCDGLMPLPLSDPEDPSSDGECRPGFEGYLGMQMADEFVALDPVPANTVEREYKTGDISGVWPMPNGPFWVTIVVHLDDQQDLDESNEHDNRRLESYYMP